MRECRFERGMALIIVMIIMMIIFLLAISLVGITTSQARYSLKRNAEILTKEAAQAGLNEMQYHLGLYETWPDTYQQLANDIRTSVANQYNGTVSPGPQYGFERFVDETGCYYSAEILPDDYTNTRCTVRCRGYLKDSAGNPEREKRLKAVFTRQNNKIVLFAGGHIAVF